jgi:hypothetical protein
LQGATIDIENILRIEFLQARNVQQVALNLANLIYILQRGINKNQVGEKYVTKFTKLPLMLCKKTLAAVEKFK